MDGYNNSNNSNSTGGTVVYTGNVGGNWFIPNAAPNATPVTTNGWVISYIGTTGVTITTEPAKEDTKKKEKERDGCSCKKCKEFYPYAEPNQDDGTLICYGCRKGYNG